MRTRALVPAVLTSSALLLSACGTQDTAGGDVVAVATTSTLGSVVGQIADCAGASATSLMSPGEDPHTFQPSSAQMVELAGAEVVVANGLQVESGLQSALDNAAADGANILEIAPLLDPLPWGADEAAHDHAEHEHEHENDHAEHDEEGAHEEHDHEDETVAGAEHDGHDHEGHDHGEFDPHFWLDASRMAAAAAIIGDELTSATADSAYAECGVQLSEELTELDAEVREILDAVPEDRRTLITDHDAFGYFTSAYGFEQAGVVIPGGSTDAEPSSAELAELAAVIEETGVPVIFSNSTVSSAIVDAVAAEASTEVQVVELFVDSVGPDGSGAETYQGMMTENATRIAQALA